VTGPTRTEIEGLVRIAAVAAADKKGTDVVALFVGETIVVTDYFLIVTGATDRQVHAIGDAIEDALREADVKPIGREGERELKWLLIDYGDFVVHVFQASERDFYRLEKLWSDAPRVDLPAAVANVTAPPDVEVADSEGEPRS
jgi:ribosome-associated protein